VWDGQVYDFEWWGIPMGAKNGDAAAKFIVSASTAQSYADLTKYIAYAPPRKDAIPLIAKDRLNDLPTAPANFKHALQINASFWADNADQINKRFQVWLTQ
jgi:putative spermidine/putrescine transport system substrate-binding protein